MSLFAAPAHTRLFADFAAALERGDTAARVETPAYRQRKMKIGAYLADLIGGKDSDTVMQHLLRVLSVSIKSTDTDTRLHAMAATAAMARMHADHHAEAGALDDADADAEFRADYSDAARLIQRDAISEVTP